MPNYLRGYFPGGTFFFTVVTYQRAPIFKDNASVGLLRESLRSTIARYPFTLDAIVVLPDHLHAIWTLPENDSDFSTRWKRVKATFSRQYQSVEGQISDSMRRKGERGNWQRRFWEHTIRDQEDFNRHSDYIHYNPVKHGLVSCASEWEHSSFRRFVARGLYPQDWGREPTLEMLGMDYE